MKKIWLASVIAISAVTFQGAIAQTAIDRLKNEQDMSTGLAKDPPPQPREGKAFETSSDRAVEKLKDAEDQTTGLAKNPPPRSDGPRVIETPADRANETLRDRQDQSTGLPKR